MALLGAVPSRLSSVGSLDILRRGASPACRRTRFIAGTLQEADIIVSQEIAKAPEAAVAKKGGEEGERIEK